MQEYDKLQQRVDWIVSALAAAILAVTLLYPVVSKAECNPVVNTRSYHFDRDRGYNENNYGLGVECGHWQVGAYKNSEYGETAYAFYLTDSKRDFVEFGLAGGVAVGYSYAPVLPIVALTARVGIARFVVIPPVKVNDRNVGVVGLQVIIPSSILN
jgi:hypothetical protein